MPSLRGSRHGPAYLEQRPCGGFKRALRIRMGDWRVIFKIIHPDLIIVDVAHRSTIYEG